MRFAEPELLWSLAVVLPPLAAFLVWTWRKKQKMIRQFVQSRLLANLTVGVSHARQKLRLVLIFAAVTLLLVAMARPQFGFRWEQSRQQGLDIVVAIDTSRSMLAQDVLPNRLMRARLAALDLLRLAQTDRLGLVAFAGTAFLQCPLTLDEEAFRQNVEALNVGIIPQGGSDLSGAIEAALEAFEKNADNHKILVLVSDGEDHDGGAIVAAQKAAKQGLRIFTLGAGTPEGELIRAPDSDGHMDFVRENGNVVKSRLNEDLLRKIAAAANGFYLPLQGTKTMEALYANGLAPLPKSESLTPFRRVNREQFHWLVLLAFAALLVEMFLPQRKRITRTAAIVNASANSDLRKAVTLFLIGTTTFSAAASPASADRRYREGDFGRARQEYDRLLQRKTNDHRIYFNAGNAAYRAQAWDEAQQRFSAALASHDLELQEKSYYNLGNTLYQAGEQAGDSSGRQSAWEQALQNFDAALKLSANDTDAKHNRDLVQRKLEELKKQEEQQKSDSKNKNQNKNQKEEKDSQQQPGENQKDSPDSKKQSQQPPPPKPGEKEKKKSPDSSKSDPREEKKQNPKDDPASQSNSDQPKPDPADASDARSGMADAHPHPMTEQEAQQVLNASRQNEKSLIFLPPADPRKASRVFKDW